MTRLERLQRSYPSKPTSHRISVRYEEAARIVTWAKRADTLSWVTIGTAYSFIGLMAFMLVMDTRILVPSATVFAVASVVSFTTQMIGERRSKGYVAKRVGKHSFVFRAA